MVRLADDTGVATVLIGENLWKLQLMAALYIEQKLGYGKNIIEVAAEDINGNVSKQIVDVIREEYVSTELANVDIPPQTMMSNPDALAVVIGVEVISMFLMPMQRCRGI